MPPTPDHQPLPASRCVLRNALDLWAEARPDKVYAIFGDGEAWTYRDLHEHTRATARGLQQLGIRQGDHVLVWLPNGREAVRTICAINYIGAVSVPINVAYRGPLLEHVIANSDARVMIAHENLLTRLATVELGVLDTIVQVGSRATGPTGAGQRLDQRLDQRVRVIAPFSTLEEAMGDLAPLERPIEPWDTQAILYTSGTTGPSKGVLCSYMHAVSSAGPIPWPCCGADDRFLVNLPIFHIGGYFIVHAFLCAGGSIAMTEGFSTATFWDDVHRTQSTAVFLLGAMATFLVNAPPHPRERDHRLRTVFIVPFNGPARGFHDRFGIDTYTIFNMTEISTPLICGPNPTKAAVAGRPRAGCEIRLVDAHDCEVPPGTAGEMILRTHAPWAMNHGYHKNAEATARAWRNGWFHTGDAFVIDGDGDYIYVDRLKDVIRRRGENISSIEVETVMLGYPGVAEAAAVPVPSEHGEDEVLAVIALAAGHNAETAEPFDHAAFLRHLQDRLAHFMVPRYVRVMHELPKTPTAKVQKAILKGEGVTAETWDREAAGIVLKRERLT